MANQPQNQDPHQKDGEAKKQQNQEQEPRRQQQESDKQTPGQGRRQHDQGGK